MSCEYHKEWKGENLVTNRPERIFDAGKISAASRQQLEDAATVAELKAWIERVVLGEEQN